MALHLINLNTVVMCTKLNHHNAKSYRRVAINKQIGHAMWKPSCPCLRLDEDEIGASEDKDGRSKFLIGLAKCFLEFCLINCFRRLLVCSLLSLSGFKEPV